MTIGEKIQIERKKKGYTQKQLAEMCNVATGTIQQYELGKRQPRLEQIRRIAHALEITISDLVDNWTIFSQEELRQDWIHKTPIQKAATFDEQIRPGSGEFGLISAYRCLNRSGKKEAVKRVEELTEIKKYTDPDQ